MIIRRIINRLRLFKAYCVYSKQSRKYMRLLGIKNKHVEGERQYFEKWKVLSKFVDVSSYRLYSHYCGNIPEIVPEHIGRIVIEPKLIPLKYRPYYEDKNMFPIIIGKENTPQTIICRIDGGTLLDADYNPINKSIDDYLVSYDRVVLKPSVNSCSGRDVRVFQRKGEKFYACGQGTELSEELLNEYGKDFVLQEAVRQHPSIAYLNKDSVNTIRIATYKSVKDESVHVLAAIIRIGKNGQYVDNAHAGGMFVGVDVKTGQLGEYACDQYGHKEKIWNGIDFSKEKIQIPNWEKVISFSQYVGKKVIHHRLLAMDISVNEEGNPVLIEYNLGGFSYWLFEFTNQKPLGDFTDEIIEFCS